MPFDALPREASPMTTAAELMKAGDVTAARAALVDTVKRSPSDVEARYALAETLIVQGDWQRADSHLDLVSTQDPQWGTFVALLRQLLRAAVHREEVFTQGRSPDLVTPPSAEIETALRILLEARTESDAGALRRAADEAAPDLTGVCDERAFDTLRDLDDRTADVLEMLTSTGKYVWTPWSAVISLELHPVERPRDLIWRAAELELRDGPTGVVYLPMTYQAAPESLNDAQRLGRETEWREHAGLTCGLGQRCLLIGDELVPFSSVAELAVSSVKG